MSTALGADVEMVHTDDVTRLSVIKQQVYILENGSLKGRILPPALLYKSD